MNASDIPVVAHQARKRVKPASGANSGLADRHGMGIAYINIEEY
jgi:hypothetical protein